LFIYYASLVVVTVVAPEAELTISKSDSAVPPLVAHTKIMSFFEKFSDERLK
jgi:hypothetical protein